MLKRLKSTLSNDGAVTVSIRISIEKVSVPSRAGCRFAVRWSKGKHKGTTKVGVIGEDGVGVVMADLDFNTTLVEGKKKVIGFGFLEAVRHAPGTEERLVPVEDFTLDVGGFYFKNLDQNTVSGCGKEITLGTPATTLTLCISLLPTTAKHPKLSPANPITATPYSDVGLDASYTTQRALLETTYTNTNNSSLPWKSLITTLYRTHGVGYDTDEIDAFLDSYKGSEPELYEKLQAKYDPTSLTDDQRNQYATVEGIPKEHTVYASSTDPMSSDYPRVGPIRQHVDAMRMRRRHVRGRELAVESPPSGIQGECVEARWGPEYLPATAVSRVGGWVDVVWENGEKSSVRAEDVRVPGGSPDETLPEKEFAVECGVEKGEGVILFGKPKPQKPTLMHHESAEPEEDEEDVVGGPLHDYETASSGVGMFTRPDAFSLPLTSRGPSPMGSDSSGGGGGGVSEDSTRMGSHSSASTTTVSFSFSSRTKWTDFKEKPALLSRPQWRPDPSPERSRESWRRRM